MKYLILSLALIVGAVGMTGCASTDEIRQNVAALEQAVTAAEAENATLRAELQAVADAGGEDSEAAQKLADALAKNESFLAEARKAIETANAALTASGGQQEEFWWEMGVGVASLFGFGGVAGALNNARKRNKDAFQAVVTAFEKAREGDGNTFDMSTVGRIVADAGITRKVDEIRKEVKS